MFHLERFNRVIYLTASKNSKKLDEFMTSLDNQRRWRKKIIYGTRPNEKFYIMIIRRNR